MTCTKRFYESIIHHERVEGVMVFPTINGIDVNDRGNVSNDVVANRDPSRETASTQAET